MRSCFLRNVVSLTVLEYSFVIRLEVFRNDYLLVLRMKPSFRVVIARSCVREIPHSNWLRTTLTYFLNTTRYVVTRRTHMLGSQDNSLSGRRAPLRPLFPYVRLGLSMENIWDPDRRPVSEGLLGRMVHKSDDSSSTLEEQCMANIPTMVHDAEYKDCTTIQKKT